MVKNRISIATKTLRL